MADLLLELFSEEIPARMQADAEAHLAKSLADKLGKPAKGFSSPRRIAATIEGLPSVQPDVNTELKGPKLGAPQAAIDGFLKKSGMKLEELTQQDGIYVAKIHQKGKPTAEILKPLIEEILRNFPWPKSMRWGSGDATWVRPLHSILCIFDGKVVPVEFAGIKAGNITYGHRFLAPGAIEISKANEYQQKLRDSKVYADRGLRKQEVQLQATEAATKAGLVLRKDEGLLEEVTGLVEWPTVLMGTIDKNYMDLPPEVLISEMRAHQKYFALETQVGMFSDKFLITANMTASDGGKAIVAGNERVLRARLADGRFFWDSDRKKKLEDWSNGLETVTYHAKLGSVADKVERVKKLSAELAPHIKADKKQVERAASLCKADLVTGMVGEFPELQGVMGRYYALAEGEKPDVADAIRDHYLPLGPSSPVPTAPVSICVALADKLDTLCSMFAIGEKPTGSKDPFALRRAALGVIRIILENNLRLPLKQFLDDAPFKDIALISARDQLVKKTEAKLHENPKDLKVGKYVAVNESATQDIAEDAKESLSAQLMAFFHDRLIVQLKDSGIRHDVIKAVIAGGDDDLVRITVKAKQLQLLTDSDIGKDVLAAYKRANNILAQEEKKDGRKFDGKASEKLLSIPEEKKLSDVIENLSPAIDAGLKEEMFRDVMEMAASMRPSINAFFDKVMVNDPVKEIRENRLRLLNGFTSTLNKIADFSKIEGDSKEQKKAA
ncbi:MAG: glycine--tRNA ligase subunit beta [Rickettsiales bacterium]|jgi:glycyl-tRNA synthetase beta chain|nr:glycine--tRNA ligase subunit beta [Rickettsiales bacterium]